jgi:hypothetical protein
MPYSRALQEEKVMTHNEKKEMTHDETTPQAFRS